MPKTTWCREHGISDKSFFYWQRILREEAYLTTLENTLTPAVKENSAPTTTDFIEIKMTDQVSSEERLTQRQLVIKPLVDALFAYLKKMEPTVPASGQLRKAYTYILNQEKYLRVFLEDGEVPIDNNASERAIRGFCIGKKNWQMIDTINGAHSSAIIYSIAETAKANSLSGKVKSIIASICMMGASGITCGFSIKAIFQHSITEDGGEENSAR